MWLVVLLVVLLILLLVYVLYEKGKVSYETFSFFIVVTILVAIGCLANWYHESDTYGLAPSIQIFHFRGIVL